MARMNSGFAQPVGRRSDVVRLLVAVAIVAAGLMPLELGLAQTPAPPVTLGSAEGAVVVRAGGDAETGYVGLTVRTGDRVEVPRRGQATLRSDGPVQVGIGAVTAVTLDGVAADSGTGPLSLLVRQLRGLTTSTVGAGGAVEVRAGGDGHESSALLRHGEMIVRVDEGTGTVTVGCEDRSSQVFFPYPDRPVPCDQRMVRTLTADGDTVDSVVEPGVPIVVAVFDHDLEGRETGRGRRAAARGELEDKMGIAGTGPPPAGAIPTNPTPTPGVSPPNDAFAGALPLAIPGTAREDTRGATTEAVEPTPGCAPIGRTVWYRLTPAVTGAVTLSTAGSTFDTVLAVYTGATLGVLTPVDCNDNDPTLVQPTSRLTVPVTAGQTYFVQVGGRVPGPGLDARSGSLTLRSSSP